MKYYRVDLVGSEPPSGRKLVFSWPPAEKGGQIVADGLHGEDCILYLCTGKPQMGRGKVENYQIAPYGTIDDPKRWYYRNLHVRFMEITKATEVGRYIWNPRKKKLIYKETTT